MYVCNPSDLYVCIYFPGGSDSKASTYNAGDPVQSLGQEDLLEKKMATQSSILAWRIPWTKEHGRLQSMGSQRIRYNWANSLSCNLFYFERVCIRVCVRHTLISIFDIKVILIKQYSILKIPCSFLFKAKLLPLYLEI